MSHDAMLRRGIPPLCHNGRGEKARAGRDKTPDQKGGGQGIAQRVGQGKAKGHRRIEDKVEYDIQIAAAVAHLIAKPRQRTIKAVQ